MTPDTTVLDGVDVEVAPANVTQEPIKSTTVASGHLGQVHFRWAVPGTHYRLVLEYEDLKAEPLRRLLNIFGPTHTYGRVLAFSRPAQQEFVIPGRVRIDGSFQNGYANVTIETVASVLDETLMADLWAPNLLEPRDPIFFY